MTRPWKIHSISTTPVQQFSRILTLAGAPCDASLLSVRTSCMSEMAKRPYRCGKKVWYTFKNIHCCLHGITVALTMKHWPIASLTTKNIMSRFCLCRFAATSMNYTSGNICIAQIMLSVAANSASKTRDLFPSLRSLRTFSDNTFKLPSVLIISASSQEGLPFPL